jgi:hypothetical protein
MKSLATQLKTVLKNYHRLIESLEPHEQSLLEDNLRQLKRNMQTGTQRLPWTSSNHEKFISVTAEVTNRLSDRSEKTLDSSLVDIEIRLNDQSSEEKCSRYRNLSQ